MKYCRDIEKYIIEHHSLPPSVIQQINLCSKSIEHSLPLSVPLLSISIEFRFPDSILTLAQFWIEYVKTIPPKELMIYDTNMKDSYGNTLVMYWIEHVNTEPPSELRHDVKNIKDKYGNTLAMLWIEHVKTDPPEWMHHDVNVTNDYGWTMAILWIRFVKSDVPEWMHHDVNVTNKRGETMAMLWIEYAKSEPPEWMAHDSTTITNNCKTALRYWIQRCSGFPPKWMLKDYDFTLPTKRDKKGNAEGRYDYEKEWKYRKLTYGESLSLFTKRKCPNWLIDLSNPLESSYWTSLYSIRKLFPTQDKITLDSFIVLQCPMKNVQ